MSLLPMLPPKKVLPCRVGEEDGFLDIDLPLIALATGSGGEVRAQALGEIDGAVMGFAVVFHPRWSAKPIEGGGATFYWGSGAFERTGPESDRFVEFVARRYHLRIDSPLVPMLPTIKADVVGLDSDPAKVREHGTKTKFFFHSSSEDRYAEVFTNINIEESLLEFHEKDSAYRIPLIRALSEA